MGRSFRPVTGYRTVWQNAQRERVVCACVRAVRRAMAWGVASAWGGKCRDGTSGCDVASPANPETFGRLPPGGMFLHVAP